MQSKTGPVMRALLIVAGGLAACAFFMPGLVVIGMFLLVLPGLVLMAMPTLFLYLLLTWLIRLSLPIANNRAAYPVASIVAAVLAALAMLPFRLAAERDFAVAAVPEIIPAAPIALSGHVRYETEGPLQSPDPPSCDWLCLAILDVPAVESVTLVRYGQTVTYGLIDADEATPEGLTPLAPEMVLLMSDRAVEGTDGLATQEALKAYWQSRLSGPQRLVIAGRPTGKPDWLLRAGQDGITQISTADGKPMLRAVRLRRTIPAIPPYLGFTAGSAATGFAGDGFVIGGKDRVTSSAFPNVSPDFLIGRNLMLKDYQALAVAAIKP